MHQGSTFGRTRKNNLPAHQLGTFAHRDQTNAMLIGTLRESDSMIFDFQFKRTRQKP